jgi:hypothetical protein
VESSRKRSRGGSFRADKEGNDFWTVIFGSRMQYAWALRWVDESGYGAFRVYIWVFILMYDQIDCFSRYMRSIACACSLRPSSGSTSFLYGWSWLYARTPDIACSSLETVIAARQVF